MGGRGNYDPPPLDKEPEYFGRDRVEKCKKTVLKRQTPPISKSISLLKRIKTLTILKSLC